MTTRSAKFAPYDYRISLDGDYQLCARCGAVLCRDEAVAVVYRGDRGVWRGIYVEPFLSDWYGIYTHGNPNNCVPRLPAKGWRAVEQALDGRESNIPVPRDSAPVKIGKYTFPFVSLLDDKHLEWECDAVDIYQREFKPSADNAQESNDAFEEQPGRDKAVDWRRTERAFVDAIDRGLLGPIAYIRQQVLQECRTALIVRRTASKQYLPLVFLRSQKSGYGVGRLSEVTGVISSRSGKRKDPPVTYKDDGAEDNLRWYRAAVACRLKREAAKIELHETDRFAKDLHEGSHLAPIYIGSKEKPRADFSGSLYISDIAEVCDGQQAERATKTAKAGRA